MNYSKYISGLVIVLLSLGALAQSVKVELVPTNMGYQLLRAGKPYYILGAGGQVHLDELVDCGGNSIRTWSLENAEKYLDEAHKHGLTVMMGLWVQHERHGFNYDDTIAVQKQLEYFTRKVKEIKDHPALLMWGIGNEVDLFYSNTKVWKAIQDIAKMIHDVDPNHPTCTVTAGLDPKEVALVLRDAPDIDIYGVNTYGELQLAVDSIDHYGWKGPYLISEWGPNGHWEVPLTKWGAPIEQSSSSKAESYANRYKLIQAEPNCIGSYVFLWGHKQETTATWYGLFTADGSSTAPVDELYKAWKNSVPKNSAPAIEKFGIQLNGKPVPDNILTAGNRFTAFANFTDRDGDALKYSWEIISESTDTKAGGDAENAPPAIPGLIKKRMKEQIEFKAPKKEGAYRLFISAGDQKGKVGYANIPFYVQPNLNKQTGVKLKERQLEFSY